MKEKFDKAAQTYTLTFEQSVPETPRQRTKKTVPIPVRFGLLDRNGEELTPQTKSNAVQGDVIVLTKKTQSIKFEGLERKPIPSLLRSFSAPVNLDYRESKNARKLRARCDSDLYNRWEALNGFALSLLVKDARSRQRGKKQSVDPEFIDALVTTTFDDALEPEFRAQALILPSGQDVARQLGRNVDPDAIFKAREAMTLALGRALGADGLTLVKTLRKKEKIAVDSETAGLRALSHALLGPLVLAKVDGALKLAEREFNTAKNMTDRLGALSILLHCQKDRKLADAALDKLYRKYKKFPLVVGKWFAIQATLPGNRGLQRVKALIRHPEFSLDNPNRARSLLGTFAAGNQTGFHRADGKAYDYYATQILALDKINPQVAARLLTSLNNWRMFERGRASHAKKALERIAATPNLSRDVQEIVDRALE